jgi:hypothetical protein
MAKNATTAKFLPATRIMSIEVTQLMEITLLCDDPEFLRLIKDFSLPDNCATCSYCDKDIIWVELFTGKKAPIEIDRLSNRMNIAFHRCQEYLDSHKDA